MKKVIVISLVFSLVVFFAACEKMFPDGPLETEVLAGSIPGLTPQQEHQHLIGDEAFGKIFTPAQGLGPVFVQTSCSNCHVGNGKGHPSTMVDRFADISSGTVNYLTEYGGPQFQGHAIPGYLPESMTSQANVFTQRLAPAVMGLGYIAALSDASILQYADSADINGDGISGRPNYVNPTSFFDPQSIHIPSNGKYIGRFGKKAEKVTIKDQVVFALKQDIGITSDFDMEDLYNVQVGINTGDDVPDPEVSSGFVNSLVFYMRTLKAPPRRFEEDRDVIEGEQIFHNIGCVSCHQSTYTTAASDIEGLSRKVFHPYSDFLLHDMGPLLDDGYPEGSANSNEWRTPPLWGIGLAKNSQGGTMFLLHDGRASTIEAVISYHGGEAASRRDLFNALSDEKRAQLIKFIESL